MPKSALVIGCASCVWDDIKVAKALGNYDAVYCVKQIGIHYPDKFDVWVTLHPEAMDAYEAQRKNLQLPDGYQIVAPPKGELSASHKDKGNINRRVSYLWPGAATNASASSGIYGAKVAMEDGFDRIVLAGIPMTAEGGHFLPETKNVQGAVRGKVWKDHNVFVCGFNEAIPRLKGKVKSVSGYTKHLLGAPTSEWLTE
jgi:hypothetical protein